MDDKQKYFCYKLSSSFPSKIYLFASNKLLEKIDDATTLFEIRNLFYDFSTKFTIIPELWRIWIKFEECTHYSDFEENKKQLNLESIQKKLQSHFVFDVDLKFQNEKLAIDFKLLDLSGNVTTFLKPYRVNSKENVKLYEKLLSFPNKSLNNEDYNAFSPRPMPPSILKKYKKACIVYKEIIVVENDVEKWFHCLTKMENDKFVIDNIEFKLGKNPTNILLWRLYLNFLKTKNDTRILNVYLRYCRIFIEDFEMRNEYQNEIKRLGNLSFDVTKWWIDYIEFEIVFGNINDAKLLANNIYNLCKTAVFHSFLRHFKNQIKEDRSYQKFLLNPVETKAYKEETNSIVKEERFQEKNINITEFKKLFFNDISHQHFALPFFIIEYLMVNSSYAIRQRFYECCKYLFIKDGKKIFCHKLVIDPINDDICKYYFNSLFISYNRMKEIKNMVITNNLFVFGYEDTMTKLLEKIQIRVKYLCIGKQNLTSNELFLMKNLELQQCIIKNVTITDNVTKSIEMIIETFINSVVFIIKSSLYTDETAENLANLKIKNKQIKDFRFENVPNFFNPRHFAIFIKNAMYDSKLVKSSCEVIFDPTVPFEFKHTFEQIMTKELKGYNKQCQIK